MAQLLLISSVEWFPVEFRPYCIELEKSLNSTISGKRGSQEELDEGVTLMPVFVGIPLSGPFETIRNERPGRSSSNRKN